MRRPEIIRHADERRSFGQREAARYLREKERAWRPIAYAVFLAAIGLILFFAYSSYVFSKYRGVVLPGVQVNNVRLGGLTERQAETVIINQLAAIHHVPVVLTYGGKAWRPKDQQIGVTWYIKSTAAGALAVGREGSVVQQWIDRFPFHPVHYVPLVYSINGKALRAYVRNLATDPNLNRPPRNATLRIGASTGYHVSLLASAPGIRLNQGVVAQRIIDSVGSLDVPRENLEVDHVQPAITTPVAARVRARVERFLSHPPVIAIGKRVVVTDRVTFGAMFSFTEGTINRRPTITLHVDPDRLRSYVSSLAGQVDRAPAEAKMSFDAGHITVISPQRDGRSLNQDTAFQALLPIVSGLKPHARLHFKVQITHPAVDLSNPASLGITHLLAVGSTSFTGAGPTRLGDITAVARTLNQDLLSPTQDISFNTLVGVNWLDRVYTDRARDVDNSLVPGAGGAMQQVATTFLRALYAAGLRLEERHAHVSRLPWYEPPTGYDAVVAPGRNWDLRFANNTGHYLLLETRVEPIRQQLYIYVYGPDLGWRVSVDQQGKVLKVYPHGPQIERVDPSLPPGVVKPISFAADGADTVIQRTIAYRNGNVHTDEIDTHYAPSQAILSVGSVPKPSPHPSPTANTTVTASPSPSVTPQPTVTPAPAPSPTPTFDH